VVNIEHLLINVGACQQELAPEDTHRSTAWSYHWYINMAKSFINLKFGTNT